MGDTPVVIIGGGATGTGILRDCALRGIDAVLVEMHDLATGTSGRFHGLLHSGARYAVKDFHSAVECITENTLLKKLAPWCVEDTGGLFIATSDDDPAYAATWLEGCRKAGIAAREVSPAEVKKEVPLISGKISRAFAVPDATVDGFTLAAANARDAEKRGSMVKTYARVTGFGISGKRITSVMIRDAGGREEELACSLVVNAAGPWAGQVASMAGEELALSPDRGIMVVFHYRFTPKVLNRLHPPGDGDIFVPHHDVTIFGTTSKTVKDPDDLTVEQDEVLAMLALGKALIPSIEDLRTIRAFAGVRPLFEEKEGQEGREATREFSLIDHGARGGPENLVSVVGGKLTTYRLMAQKAVDLIAARTGVTKPCSTATEPLSPPSAVEEPGIAGLLCECEQVKGSTVLEASGARSLHSLSDIRRLTRMGMGPCQGTFCAFRAAGYLAGEKNLGAGEAQRLIAEDLAERWKGVKPVLWGWQARQSELARRIYMNLFSLERQEGLKNEL
ncbi:MAG: FAD-dependent oxidoreductase [Candidatus Eremiobacteraeota bacterium]|nr:FAD-dependent oxidoreductase [Candidatus Eremiobacteraeota bacterium]